MSGPWEEGAPRLFGEGALDALLEQVHGAHRYGVLRLVSACVEGILIRPVVPVLRSQDEVLCYLELGGESPFLECLSDPVR